MKSGALLLLGILLVCTSNLNSNVEGEYLGFWAETLWVIKLKGDNRFEITSEGHFGDTSTSGNYTMKNDTLFFEMDNSSAISKYTDHEKFLLTSDNCLVDVESRYDYCKIRSGYWASVKRNIYYPQIAIDSARNRPIVNHMLQQVIDKIEVETKLDSTIYMEEYYEINDINGFTFNRLNSKIVLLSKIELKEKGITNYMTIEGFDLGEKSALIEINIEPYLETFNYTIVSFEREDNAWVMD